MGGTSGALGVSGRCFRPLGRLASGLMSKTAILAKLTAQPGKRDELVEALGPLVEAVDQEPGTELYVLHTSATEPDVVWFYELYTDEAALNAHRTSETMAKAVHAVRIRITMAKRRSSTGAGA